MKHSSTSSLISSLMLASLAMPAAPEPFDVLGPSEETICSLQMFARTYRPDLKDGWLNEHSLSGKAI